MDYEYLHVRRLPLSGTAQSPTQESSSSCSGGNAHVPACASRLIEQNPSPSSQPLPSAIYPHGYEILHFLQRALGAAGIAVQAFGQQLCSKRRACNL